MLNTYFRYFFQSINLLYQKQGIKDLRYKFLGHISNKVNKKIFV